MTRIVFAGLLVVHGLLHLLGFAKAFGLAPLPQLALAVSKPWGVMWLLAAVSFVLAGVLRVASAEAWWMVALVACVVSQGAIVVHWSDAKMGTWLNAVVLVAVVSGAGAWSFARQTRELVERLEGDRRVTAGEAYHAGQLEDVPAPVQRYLRAALPEGQPRIAAVSIAQSGTLNVGEAKDDWKPFRASHRAVTARPGFVWAARVEVALGIAVQVHDAYIEGSGLLRPLLLGLLPLGARSDEGGELARGELMRFLAEAPWYPTALLPHEGLHWEPIDERTARATLTDRGVSTTLTFGFGEDDLIEWVRAEARGRSVGDRVVPTPWEGRWYRYETREGMRVPLEAEVAWLLPQARKVYWRGRVTAIAYELDP